MTQSGRQQVFSPFMTLLEFCLHLNRGEYENGDIPLIHMQIEYVNNFMKKNYPY